MGTCYVAGIVKGLVERGDATRHFGSLIGFTAHLHQAIADGVVDATGSVTDAGRAWYAAEKLNELKDCRAYFWDRRDWTIKPANAPAQPTAPGAEISETKADCCAGRLEREGRHGGSKRMLRKHACY
jgi:hypothetical protein